ncbi:hypothetical protein BDQ17DRAFT_1260065 [Cyathus striatus]|nr:hypothetical protein BDQ17DRAFT_1260065 [Cyathus striatus]
MLRHLVERHPSWEEILAGDEQYRLSLRISIEEQEKLNVPQDYLGNSPLYSTHHMRRSYNYQNTATTHILRAESPQRICSNPTSQCYSPRSIPHLTYSNNTASYNSSLYNYLPLQQVVPAVSATNSCESSLSLTLNMANDHFIA